MSGTPQPPPRGVGTGLRRATAALTARFLQLDRHFQGLWTQLAAATGQWLLELRTGARNSIGACRQKAHRVPLVYKLSFLITVLIVTCMSLLGSIIVQQQTQLFEAQIREQGSALARLMAKAAKEPLLAEDQLALDAITTGFSNNGNVKGTALVSLEGETISHTGEYHDGNSYFQKRTLNELIADSAGSLTWNLPGSTRSSPRQVVSFVQPVTFQDVTAGYAMITLTQSAMELALQQAKGAIIGATVLIILLGIGMAFVLGRRISEPIDQLVDASRAIGKGEYSFSFKEDRSDEIGQLMVAFKDMAEGMLEKSQVMAALSRYVSPSVAKEILANLNDVELGGKRIEGSVIFADIVGFTQIAENIRPEELVSILNRYFSLITHACEINQGTVDKYMGDGVMLVFGAPQPDADHRFHAVCCSLLIQQLIARENRQREEQGLFPVKFSIGINSGTMLAGNMGSKERMEYTVVGDTVNLASRLCSIANSEQIVISRDLYMADNIRERILAGEYQAIRLRGIRDPVTTYFVEGLGADWQEIVENQFHDVTHSQEHDASETPAA